MTLSSMAWNNFKGNMYRYIMYFLSNVFAVASYFIFINFIFHPEIDFNNLGGHYVAAQGAVMAVRLCLGIIVIFSIIFVGYSTSIFLDSRGKEFGLLSLYGMTKNQIRKYVFIENSIISTISLLVGLFVGMLFSKLFLMIMEYFMEISIGFNISLKAVLQTGILFFLLFEIVAIFMLVKIDNKEITEQIKTSKKAKEMPEFSKKKAIFGVFTLLLGYFLAWIASDAFVILGMIPITTIVCIGTYYLFTQFSIYGVNKLRNRESIEYDKYNLIVLNQIIYKLEDTAKVLFIASILWAVTFTATETIVSFYTSLDSITGFDTVEDIGIYQADDNLNDRQLREYIENKLIENDVKVKASYEIEGFKAKNLSSDVITDDQEYTQVISEKNYNELAKINNEESLDLSKGQVVYNFPHAINNIEGKTEYRFLDLEEVGLVIDGEEYEFKLPEYEIRGSLISFTKMGEFDYFIMNNEDYEEIYSRLGDESKFNYIGMKVDSYKKSYDISKLLKKELEDNGYYMKAYFKAVPHIDGQKSFGMVLFIGFFTAFLFFFSAGSMIYFKLFNDLRSDREDYNILRKIGITEKELNVMISRQIGIIFFFPFIIATSHALFALKSLSNLLKTRLVFNGFIVILGYLILQVLYYLLIKNRYTKMISYEV